MTTSGSGGLLTFVSSRGGAGRGMGKASWKMLCGTLFVLCAAIAGPAQTLDFLLKFDGTNGFFPNGPLVQGRDGSFYGVASYGGMISACGESFPFEGCGTVFKMTPGGELTTLHLFDRSDGAQPSPGLVQGTDGNFYGTTTNGGTNGDGTVFKVTPGGVLTTLYSFCAQTACADGSSPQAALVQGTDGDFYGTTSSGGIGNCGNYGAGCGTVFKISPEGTLMSLHSFNLAEGIYPDATLVQGTDGNFYGTTTDGGANGRGTVFRITPAGILTALYSFCAQVECTDGFPPFSALVQADDGNFYGTSGNGNDGTGTFFRITPNGALTTLHLFVFGEGINPSGAVVQGTDGNFYGRTWAGGLQSNSCGTFYKITPTGALTVLYSFDNWTEHMPSLGTVLGVVQATAGSFYGTTENVGTSIAGKIFRMGVGLGWFNEELPNYGKPGDIIKILGTDLTGATHVRFAGNAASFTVVSPTEIDAIVPPFLTTGYVKVTLPSGTMHSNTKFRVLPQITSFAPDSGSEGTLVVITGVSLTQTTSVTIGGVSASFVVVNDTTVNATVPTGATTGEISITTQGGTVATTTNFTVE